MDIKRLAEKIWEETPNIWSQEDLARVKSWLEEAINDAVIEKMMNEDPDFEAEAREIQAKAYTRAVEVARREIGSNESEYIPVQYRERIAAAIEKLRDK